MTTSGVDADPSLGSSTVNPSAVHRRTLDCGGDNGMLKSTKSW